MSCRIKRLHNTAVSVVVEVLVAVVIVVCDDTTWRGRRRWCRQQSSQSKERARCTRRKYIYIYIYIFIYRIIVVFEDRGLVSSCLRLGLSSGLLELKFLGRIASFEHRLRGEAPTPLALPCPCCTSTWTRIGAERDKREVAETLTFEKVVSRLRLYLDVCSVCRG